MVRHPTAHRRVRLFANEKPDYSPFRREACRGGQNSSLRAPLAGLPAIRVPCGLTSGNLPVGLQLSGRRFEESTLYRIAAVYERHAGNGTGVPPRFAT